MIAKSILAGILFAFLATATMLPLAAAQAYPTDKNGPTLEEELLLAKQKIDEVKAHPGEGSGTPVLGANGVVGASTIVGAVFGGIFVAFVVQAKRHAMVNIR